MMALRVSFVVIVVALSIVDQILAAPDDEDGITKSDSNDTKQCLGNRDDQASLSTIKPQIFYFNVGGNGPSGAQTNNRYKYVFNYNYQDSEFREAAINSSLYTKVITHGFTNSFNGTDNGWMQAMIDTLDQSPTTNYNIFVLNWPNEYVPDRDGTLTGYSIVAGTTKTIGSYLGRFLIRMKDNIGLPIDKTHLLGHSLGAQVMGFVGKYLKAQSIHGLARITGLDAAGPCFNLAKSQNHLNADDANYVDAIHTNTGGYGTFSKVGNRDVFINQGTVQPGCGATNLSCSHQRVHDLFTYPINKKCHLVAYQCKDYEHFSEGNCPLCQQDETRCTLVNFPINFGSDEFEPRVQRKVAVKPNQTELESTRESNKSKDIYFVSTGNNSQNDPLCRQHYQVRLLTSKALLDGWFKGAILTLGVANNTSIKYKVTMKEQNKNLWTGLLAFAGDHIKFDTASMELSSGLKDEDKMALSVAYMSHVCPNNRQLYSSILCSPSVSSESSSSKVTLSECSKLTSAQFEAKLNTVTASNGNSNKSDIFNWLG